MAQKIFLGTELKLNVTINPIDGHSIKDNDYDFSIELFCGSNKQSLTIGKSDVKFDETSKDNCKICFDTTEVGSGRLKLKITGYVPDGDFKDNKRTEIIELDTGIDIIKGQ